MSRHGRKPYGRLELLRILVAFSPGVGTALVLMGIYVWQSKFPPPLALPKISILPILIVPCAALSVVSGWFIAMLNPDFPKIEGELKTAALIRWIVLYSFCQIAVAPVIFVISCVLGSFFLA